MPKKHKLPVGLTKHHRKSKFAGGNNSESNISIVPDHKHRAWHLLFREGDPHYVAMVVNRTWIDPEFELIVQRRLK